VAVPVDVFESFRVNQKLGEDFALRWMRFINEVRHHVLPARLLESMTGAASGPG